MKRAVIVVITLIAIAASFLVFRRGGSQEVGPYRFVAVERGDLESLVSSTGKLDAVTTVQVGTQVSGIISKIFADFNDHVTKNQVIALIDTTLLGSSLREAASNLQRNQAQLEQAERELRRIEPLYRKELVAEVDYNNAQYNLAVARASTRAAETALERATRTSSTQRSARRSRAR